MELERYFCSPNDKPVESKHLIVLVFILIVFIAHVLISLNHSHLSRMQYHDQMIFEQAMASLMRGDALAAPYECKSFPMAAQSHCAVHFQPVLYLLAPIYSLYPHTMLLKTIEIIWMLSSAVPLFLICRKRCLAAWESWMICLIFLFDWSICSRMFNDFQPDNLSIPLYFWICYFILTQSWHRYFVMLGLVLLVKETEAFTILLLGLFVFLTSRNVKVGSMTILLSAGWLFLSFFIIIPYYTNGEGYPFLGLVYSHLGHTTGEILKSIFLNPMTVLSALTEGWNIRLINNTFSRFFYIPFLSPVFLIPQVFSFLSMILSHFDFHKAVDIRYLSATIPFIYTGLVHGYQKIVCLLHRDTQLHGNGFLKCLLGAILVHNLILFAVYGFFDDVFFYLGNRYDAIRSIDPDRLEKLTSMIPIDAGLSADYHLAPYFLHSHPRIFCFPYQDDHTEWMLFYQKPEEMGGTDKMVLMTLMRSGFLPAADDWRDGYFVLNQADSSASNAFLRCLQEDTRSGFDFTEGRLPLKELFYGFSIDEPDGIWSEGMASGLFFSAGAVSDSGLTITITGHHPVSYLPEQQIIISVNAIPVAVFDLQDPYPVMEVDVPADLIDPGVNTLEMVYSQMFVPCLISDSPDCRQLAFKFFHIDFE